ncbi:ABC transporter ATP-binding protein [Jeotgalibacillus sp. ET6]|uniref:ABC transporter ATP-binding protein n=1 Tax=Jeotgalibacillus sp. ET6 TaxID=3037260 RepID=UPI0024182F90|nr:ABC transporter ATP-binding protein [Jeotgalibacillus sp. ET6]MDG5472671.1 ABC transporter ATP-binding protein [Jeotgalibacillus sp. ET6]
MEGKEVIKLAGLTKSYGGENVLDEIHLTVYEGQIVGYIGPNGAGKSTTVKLMLGLIEDYYGDIYIFGENLKDLDYSYKRRIGYVPENAEIYDSLTAAEYLIFIAGLYGIDEEEALEKARRLMEQFNIEHVLHSRLSSFSKGMKQKVLIISSLLHNPDVLFLDEPLSGLDANSMMVVKEILALLARQGKTIFYSSHIMDIVEKISHRIVLLSGGSIVADGTFDELKEKNKQGTLEDIFNDLTGFHQHKEIASAFVEIVQGETV